MRFLCIGFSLIFAMTLCACRSKDRSGQTLVWTNGNGAPPAVFLSQQFERTERSLLVGVEIVQFSKQRWGAATVEGGSTQMISSPSGVPQYRKAKFFVSPDVEQSISTAKLDSLHERRFAFLSELKEKKILPKGSKILSDPELTIHISGTKYLACYAIDVLNVANRTVENYLISPRFKILKKETVSSEFEANAWIYTIQNFDQLQQVLLRDLLDAPILQSTTHQVSSQAPESVSPHNAPWKFATDDPRFDQVQAFYFIRQGIEFFAKDLGFTIPTAIQVETFMGYPEKVNAAFTYRNQIRLGSGDGITYRNLARDPSVVIHELGHIVTGLLAHLPTQREGGSINEGFVDFFAGSYLNDPRMGHRSYVAGPYKRNLEDFIPYGERTGGLYHDSQIVSGTLWQIRSGLGAAKSQRLAIQTLIRVGPATSLLEFAKALRLAAATLPADEIAIVNGVLRKYAWPE